MRNKIFSIRLLYCSTHFHVFPFRNHLTQVFPVHLCVNGESQNQLGWYGWCHWCQVCHAPCATCRMGTTGGGLGEPLSTVQLVSAFLYYPIFSFHAYMTVFFKKTLFFIFNATWKNLFLNSKEGLWECTFFVSTVWPESCGKLSVLVLEFFIKAGTYLLGFYMKFWSSVLGKGKCEHFPALWNPAGVWGSEWRFSGAGIKVFFCQHFGVVIDGNFPPCLLGCTYKVQGALLHPVCQAASLLPRHLCWHWGENGTARKLKVEGCLSWKRPEDRCSSSCLLFTSWRLTSCSSFCCFVQKMSLKDWTT